MRLSRLKQSFPGRVVQRFLADDGGTWTVAIAWGGLFAMIPVILSISSLVGYVLGFAGITQEHLVRVFASRVRDANLRTELVTALTGALNHRGLFGVLGIVGLYFSASGLFGSMERAFAMIYSATPRSFIRARLVGMAMIVVLAFLAGGTVLSSTALPVLRELGITSLLPRGIAPLILQSLVGTIAGLILFGLIYYVVPPLRLRWSQVWPGAVVAGVLFELLGLIFPVYLSLNPVTGAYGQFFGLLFVLLTYFYMLGLITVIGAEVNAVSRPV
jgi:membrane protein